MSLSKFILIKSTSNVWGKMVTSNTGTSKKNGNIEYGDIKKKKKKKTGNIENGNIENGHQKSG
jgi:hypothetical protein